MSAVEGENPGPSTSIQNAVTSGINKLKRKFRIGSQEQGKKSLGKLFCIYNGQKLMTKSSQKLLGTHIG